MKPTVWQRVRRSKITWALGGLLLAVAVWLTPRFIREVVTVDGDHRWRSAEAPPQRSFVWKPAETVAIPYALAEGESFVRPQIADGGGSLYFTIRRRETSDIYVSRLEAGRWSQPEPIAALNSPGNDVGPIFSEDGQELYLYSDRPGGLGGSDLYVSRRTADGWSAPENLGPRINTPANEFDPTVGPDGKLYFSSNRTPAMQRVAEDAAANPDEPPAWSATLRAMQGMSTFDIYVADRREQGGWNVPQQLAGINRKDANEGEPCLATNGLFIYFSSDRPNPHGGEGDYDLYRARLRNGRAEDIENLGSGVNTASNEHEPAFSPEGFRLYFSSDRSGQADDLYTLFASTATETVKESGWDASNATGLLAWIQQHQWWIILALLIAAFLASLIWYMYMASRKRAPVPGFFLAAILLHLLLGGGAFLVTIGHPIVAQLQQAFDEVFVISEPDPTPTSGSQAYEKIADLKNIETVETQAVPRQSIETPNVPVKTDSVIPSVPTKVSAEPLPERLATAPELPQQTQPDQPKLTRSTRAVPQFDTPQLQLEQMQADTPQQPTEQQPESTDVQVAKANVTPQNVATPKLQPAPSAESPTVRPTTEQIAPAQPAPAAPAQQVATANPLSRATRPQVQLADAPTIEFEQMQANNSPSPANAAATPNSVEVQVAKANLTPQNVTAPQIKSAPSVDSPSVRPNSEAVAPAANSAPSTPSTNVAMENPLARSTRAQVQLAENPQIQLEQIETTGGAPANQPSTPDAVEVQVAKANVSPQDVSAPQLKSAENSASPSIRPNVESVSPSSAAADATGPATPTGGVATANPLSRAARAQLTFAEGPQIKLEQLAADAIGGSPAGGPASPDSVDVQVAKAGQASDAAPNFNTPGAADALANLPQPKLSADTGMATAQGAPNSPAPKSLAIGAPQLSRAQSVPGAFAASDAVPLEAMPVGDGDAGNPQSGGAGKVAAVDVGVQRSGAAAIPAAIAIKTAFNGPSDAQNPRLTLGAIARANVESPLRLGRMPDRLDRIPTRSARLVLAEGEVGLASMLRFRGLTPEAKQDLVKAFGGPDDTLIAVKRGLSWLERHQHPDGRWSMNKFHEQCKDHGRCSGSGSADCDSAATAFALLPFLGDGHTHMLGEHRECVERGLRWLVDHQDENGKLFSGGASHGHMYSHGVSSIALCEAYGMTKADWLREPAQKAVDYIINAQHSAGGWRYSPRESGDTSVVGWQIMALKSAQMAGLDVPQNTLDKARNWLIHDVGGQGDRLGTFGYTDRNPKLSMTAEGLLCIEYLGAERTDPRLIAGSDYILRHLKDAKNDTSYMRYYGTQATYHLQGQAWKSWSEEINSKLTEKQVKTGGKAGTWDPKDTWEQQGGRIYSTSLNILMLEVVYRHLPLYQALRD